MREIDNASGEVSKVPCLTFTRLLPGPVERVWEYLTDTTRLPAWFGEDSHLEPGPGGAVRLMGGHIRGIVTQWHPPTKLVYTWNVFDPEDGPAAVSNYPESYPTFELESRGEDVVLTFRHFPIIDRFVPQSAMGWHTMLDLLEAALRDGEVPDRAELTARNAKIYGVDLDNIAR